MARAKAGGGDLERSRRWTALVSEWRSSGVRQAAFCRERGLNANTFSYWKRRVLRQGPGTRRQRRVTEAAAGGDGFTPVRVLVSRIRNRRSLKSTSLSCSLIASLVGHAPRLYGFFTTLIVGTGARSGDPRGR